MVASIRATIAHRLRDAQIPRPANVPVKTTAPEFTIQRMIRTTSASFSTCRWTSSTNASNVAP